eukprot:snap_masked-scaffold_26-processed-gene-3.66-mRNA-1 protein AED:1.00 eAED:1.00 QI:0/0/0/0/1/1/4/0/115
MLVRIFLLPVTCAVAPESAMTRIHELGFLRKYYSRNYLIRYLQSLNFQIYYQVAVVCFVGRRSAGYANFFPICAPSSVMSKPTTLFAHLFYFRVMFEFLRMFIACSKFSTIHMDF